MYQFKIIEPISIGESQITSSSITEDEYGVWSSGTTYSSGTYVIRNHSIYLCRSSSTGDAPESNIYDDSEDPATGYWEYIGATNKYRMFDEKSRAVSSDYETISVSITPGAFFNAISLLNVDAETVLVTVTDSVDGEVYRKNVSMLDNSSVNGWYSWLFSPITRKSVIVLLDLPAYPSATITVDIYRDGETIEVGEIVVGVTREIGATQWGYTVGLEDYSTKDVEDGVVTLEPGVTSDTGSFELLVPHSRKNYVRNILRANRGKGIVFIGVEDFEETISYAFLQGFDMSVSNRQYAYCSIEYEELSA